MRSPRVRVALIDYGAGNLRSIGRALTLAGAEVGVVTQAPTGERVDGIVLPGVGAFGAAMARLQAAGFPDWIRAQVADGIPLLGVRSEEHTSELQSRSDLVCRLLLEKTN